MVRVYSSREETKTGVRVILKCSCGFKGVIESMHEHLTVDHTYPSGVAKIVMYYAMKNKKKDKENDLWSVFD